MRIRIVAVLMFAAVLRMVASHPSQAAPPISARPTPALRWIGRWVPMDSGLVASISAAELASHAIHRAVPVRHLNAAGGVFPPRVTLATTAGVAAPFAAMAPGQAEEIARLDFDDEAFPPAKWVATDDLAGGTGKPDQFRWGRVTCDHTSGSGAGWSIGAGAKGRGLACRSPYSAPIQTTLAYGPVDMRRFPGGLEVQFNVKLNTPDLPVNDRAFAWCAQPSAVAPPTCYTLTDVVDENWGRVAPTVFDGLGSSQQAIFFFVYRDPAPTGANWGVLMDDVVLRGLGSTAPTATTGATSAFTPRPTPSPQLATRTPGVCPTSVVTAHPPATSGPSPTPWPEGFTRISVLNAESFDGPIFPPPGWRTDDLLNGGSNSAGKITWGRTACRSSSPPYAVWSLGGGMRGSQLDCCEPYQNPVVSRLVYGPMDLRPYSRGFRVWLKLMGDGPDEDYSLRYCAAIMATQMAYCNYLAGLEHGDMDHWAIMDGPLPFSYAGGQREVYLLLDYVDESPSGHDLGMLIDDVIIEGVANLDTPTPGSLPLPSPTNLSPPPGRGSTSYLPAILRHAPRSALAPRPTPTPGSIAVTFGVAVDGQGRLQQPGTAFQVGIPQLTARLAYDGITSGTYLSWEWYYDDHLIDLEGLRARRMITVSRGTIDTTIVAARGGPLPIGTYRLRASLGLPPVPATEAVARIQTDPPPGATARPATATYVAPPPATPGASATPNTTPLPPNCTDLPANGDFESGPQAWALETNAPSAADQALDRVIRRGRALNPPINPANGDWLAMLGGAAGRSDVLKSASFDFFDPATIRSASLRFSIGMETDALPNGNPDDSIVISLDNPDAPMSLVMLDESEETIGTNQWYELASDDFTQYVARQSQWTRGYVRIASTSSLADSSTRFFVDRMAIRVCRQTAAGRLAPASGRQSPALVLPLTLPQPISWLRQPSHGGALFSASDLVEVGSPKPGATPDLDGAR